MTPPPPAPTRRPQRADADYVPQHLRHFVFHSQDDFYVSRHFDPLLLSHLMYEGFLPIASEFQDKCFLLPKLHRQRCLLLIKPDHPQHVPKIVRKKAKKFKFVLNRDFSGVVEGCHEKHGIPWLYPPIVEGFKTLFQAGDDGVELYPGSKVRFITVELYDEATDKLVAGELGYTVGSVYTSLTGFSRANGAGTVQLHALSKFLYLAGFKLWDLGMSMDYKMSLGAKDFERDDFLEELYKWRPHEVLMKLDESRNEGDVRVGVSVKALLDNARLPAGTSEKKQKEEDVDGENGGKDSSANGMKEHGEENGKDLTEEKREAGAKRKLSLDEEQQGEEKKGKSESDARSAAEADADAQDKAETVVDGHSSSTD
ncbi:Leucyl/phenylalanyl-tRNA--protein transferase [Phytophthora citrophthora]|uniref:Leucyl/phenylalanyl-tRNA--protein transferase n=1 Tax=Phytophthora citrophthora TaxID=4793 RepID=A0AAD9GAV5_9STRA|nr:Leucyl/phenylalanyl-tRNA--protein transferase [Phytophthora citrophthora]